MTDTPAEMKKAAAELWEAYLTLESLVDRLNGTLATYARELQMIEQLRGPSI